MKSVETSPVLFFYCTKDQNPEQVLQNLVRQLVQLRPVGGAEDLNEFLNDRIPLSGDKSNKVIRKLLGNHESATVVIDALDSCALPDASRSKPYTYIQLLEDLTAIMKNPPCRLKVLATSQGNNAKIERFFEDLNKPETDALGRCISLQRISTDQQPRDDIARLIRHTAESWLPSEFLPKEKNGAVVARAKQTVVDFITVNAGAM
jgi:hypothetical protein